jgi:PAS domain S-box-containing protein
VVGLWQAFVWHDESRFALLSYSLLVGGLIFSVLFGFTVYLAQKAWNRSAQLLIYRMSFENSGDGLLLTSPDGSIQAANPSACSILQRTEDEICREGRNGITDAADPRLKAFMEQRARTGSARGELTFKYKNGTSLPVEASSVIFKDPGGRLRTSLAFRDISERKKWEQRLKEQAALLELAHDAIMVRDLQSRIIFWNKGAAIEYGWPAEEALGKVTHQLLQTVFPIPLAEIEQAVRVSGHWEGELLHTTRSGEQIIVASRWSLRSDEEGRPQAFLEINRNITVRKRAEAELILLNERLSLATQVASLGVWDLDLRTRFTVWDDTLFEMYGIPRKIPMPYEDWAHLVHPEDLPGAEASLKRVIDLKTQDYVEFRIIRPDGALRYCSSAQGVVLDEHGAPVRIVGVGMDITERKQIQTQLEASARLSALGVMAGGVAHEVNTPLMIVHAAASDLLSTVREEGQISLDEVIKKATVIRGTAERIARIVQSLRRIAREGSQDRFFPVQAAKIVEDALEVCQARFKANSVKLLLPENDLNIMVCCREVQIAQILLNLLTNSFDAVEDIEGEKWVRLEVEKRGESVAFSVLDSGPGVPEKLRSRIMEPFFTTKEVGKGTGLGLSLSRTIAEEHGGKLELAEEAGHTCFVLTLPLVQKKESLWN